MSRESDISSLAVPVSVGAIASLARKALTAFREMDLLEHMIGQSYDQRNGDWPGSIAFDGYCSHTDYPLVVLPIAYKCSVTATMYDQLIIYFKCTAGCRIWVLWLFELEKD